MILKMPEDLDITLWQDTAETFSICTVNATADGMLCPFFQRPARAQKDWYAAGI